MIKGNVSALKSNKVLATQQAYDFTCFTWLIVVHLKSVLYQFMPCAQATSHKNDSLCVTNNTLNLHTVKHANNMHGGSMNVHVCIGACRAVWVANWVRLGCAAFDAQLWKVYFVTIYCVLYVRICYILVATCLRVWSLWYEYAWFEITWAMPGYARACRCLYM